MTRVILKNLCKYFQQIKAVDGLNLEIAAGEFLALLGPSGCGKTTTLLTIAGFYKPDRGEIYFDDKLVNDLPPRLRDIGMVFQSYALYPHMTVLNNIAFPLKLRRVPKAERERRVMEVAELLEIADLMDRKPGQLSGGQQQRVALARALVRNPSLLLLDEPLSNLDAKLRIYMRAELKRLQKELRITTIFVTHDQVEAMTMADRIAVLNKGRLQQIGSPEELYDLPANVFVASFIGTPPMNLLDSEIEVTGATYRIVTPYFSFLLPQEIITRLKRIPSDGVVLGVRPEDVLVGEGDLKGMVYVTEPMGKDELITIQAGDARLKALVPSRLKVNLNERVRFSFRTERIQLFDRKTGTSLYREE
ncbi:MAG: inositol-phosphate transport system ATP-binding protein [Thermotogota bacterium]|nr:inositol-phosphate transport system ATP-binding protein [Thermotogota bacterium]MDK2864091.1 inositol-phosphate transport system ATP-binding protein [Thermotogota bacterium]